MLAPYRLVLATSQSDAAYFGRYLADADRLRVTGNGIDVARYRVADRPAAGDVHRWIYWGRLSANKRVDCLIDCVERLQAAGHRVDLLIAGKDVDGLAAGYQARIDAAGLGDQVRIAPPLSDADLKAELRERTVFITGSEYEGFGLTLLEAMAAGLLVVCRDVEPMNGFVQSGVNGLCLNFDGSDGDLHRLVDFVSMDTARQQAMRAASTAFADTYDWPRIAGRFIAAYRDALAVGP
jgi:alpha-1,3-mannosyltransferase